MDTIREQRSAWRPHRERNGASAVQFRSSFVRYGFAVVCLTLAFFVRYAATPLVHERNPFTFFLPAVLLAAWYGGWGAGIAAVVGGFLLGDYFFTGPTPGLGPYRPPEVSLLGVYLLISGCGIVLIHL